jgi:thioesterase domain-containing protein
MAKLLSAAPAADSFRAVVPLQTGTGTPFFCVHGAGGSVFPYIDLARTLGQQHSFYGLQSVARISDVQLTTSIERMATTYAAEIQKLQPHGPYLLGGWSMGGLIAIELARQLSLAGEEIGLLGLVDTYPPAYETSASGRRRLSLVAQFAADLMLLAGEHSPELHEHFLTLDEAGQRASILQFMKQNQLLGQNASADEVNRMLSVFEANSEAADAYTLQPVEHRILLLSAEAGGGHGLADAWRAWGRAGIDFHVLPGDHYTMLRPPYLSAVAEQLRDALNTASGRSLQGGHASCSRLEVVQTFKKDSSEECRG